LDDKEFGPLAAVAIVVFGLRQGFCQAGLPLPDAKFCFESRQNFPKRERAVTVNLLPLTREKREVL